MSDKFDCLMVRRNGSDAATAAIEKIAAAELPPGDVLIRVACSSLNYKDALACHAHPGVVRKLPHVPGIDAAGKVAESTSADFQPGDEVLVTGYDMGTSHWGGYSEFVRVPAEWVVAMPTGMTPEVAMTYGTAGFTAAQCVAAILQHGIEPDDGVVAVTGASGGVGSLSVAILAKLGYRVVAVTGKPEQASLLEQLGASRVISREDASEDSGKPLLPTRWAAAVDTVGGNTLATLLRSTQHRGCVAACGLAASADLPLTVYPFILRGITLAGIDSAQCPRDSRLKIWQRLAHRRARKNHPQNHPGRRALRCGGNARRQDFWPNPGATLHMNSHEVHSQEVVVIGAGAAGLLAATQAAEQGRQTLLLEKNRKPGTKILMSGGTRCNLTQATDRRGIVEAFGRQGRFLHSALAALGPDELVAMFDAEGVPTKVEATGKIFPVSDRAVDVVEALKRMLQRSGAELRLESAVQDIWRSGEQFVIGTSQGEITTEKIILTSGGQSYPGCGTTGDGYAWAKQLGHKIVPPRPSLVPLLSDAAWVNALSGVTVPDVGVRIVEGDASTKPQATGRGSFLFTHFGLSGPVVMDVSRAVTARPDSAAWQAVCDFLPAINEQQLSDRIAAGKQTALAVVTEWLPKRLAEALFTEAEVPLDCRVAELSKKRRNQLLRVLKQMPIPIRGSQGFKKAEVTAGGVDLREVDSKTMQSKLCENLYFAGEILDLDGPIGGYNFQAAFSTGWLAGLSV